MLLNAGFSIYIWRVHHKYNCGYLLAIARAAVSKLGLSSLFSKSNMEFCII